MRPGEAVALRAICVLGCDEPKDLEEVFAKSRG